MKKIVILISGRGSNMEAIIHAQQKKVFNAHIAAVISNRPDAKGLITARTVGIPTAVVDHKSFSDRAAFDCALMQVIDSYAPDVVVLAGFMRILTEGFIDHYQNRLLNIHPSLLPAFTGLNTHARAIASGARFHGCSVHLVTPVLDEGPIIAQAVVPILDEDTPETLAARVLEEEHRIYPLTIGQLLEGRLVVRGNRVKIIAHSDSGIE